MKELIIRLLIACIGFFITYLIGSFYNITFFIKDWSNESRFVISLMGAFFALALFTYPSYKFENK